MIIHQLDSLASFQRHWQRSGIAKADQKALAKSLCAPHQASQTPFSVRAFSYPAGEMVELTVSWGSPSSEEPNWRESLICPKTGLNARLRACVQIMDSHLNLYPDSKVYLTEQVTPLFQYLRKRLPNLLGSEYLGADSIPGSMNQQGVRHEDLTNLSFPDNSVEAVLSFECLEHIPDFMSAISEGYRVLRPGGRLLVSAPFAAGQQEHVIRARVLPDGSINHLLPPEYHGDPVQSTGCLCFTYFGWRLLDDLRGVGFSDAYVVSLWSQEFGYLGDELLFCVAVK